MNADFSVTSEYTTLSIWRKLKMASTTLTKAINAILGPTLEIKGAADVQNLDTGSKLHLATSCESIRNTLRTENTGIPMATFSATGLD